MKTLLNLLPEGKKDSIQSHLRSRFLLWQLFLLFLLEVFYLTILVSIFLILDFQFRSLDTIPGNVPVAASQNEDARLSLYEKKFQEANETVGVMSAINRSHLYFSQVFVLIDGLLPDGIVVERLATKEYTVSLFGKARTREDLLLFDEKLKAAGACITAVAIPIQNLFSQENIDFQVDFTVTPECLRKDTL